MIMVELKSFGVVLKMAMGDGWAVARQKKELGLGLVGLANLDYGNAGLVGIVIGILWRGL